MIEDILDEESSSLSDSDDSCKDSISDFTNEPVSVAAHPISRIPYGVG